jgi:hypothetical protein
MQTTSGVTYNGTNRYFFHVDLTQDDMVDGYLPPSAANPWFLSVKEGGYVNTKGFVNDFSMTVFGNNTSTTYTAPNPMTSTVEKQETIFWIPLDPATSLNHSPVLTTHGPFTVYEGTPLTFTVNATVPTRARRSPLRHRDHVGHELQSVDQAVLVDSQLRRWARTVHFT